MKPIRRRGPRGKNLKRKGRDRDPYLTFTSEKSWMPEQRLFYAMLIRKLRDATSTKATPERRIARKWFRSKSYEVCSFLWTLDMLGITSIGHKKIFEKISSGVPCSRCQTASMISC